MRSRNQDIRGIHIDGIVEAWRLHQMETLPRYWGESTGHRWIPLTKATMLSFDFFSLSLNKRLSKQSRRGKLSRNRSHHDVTLMRLWCFQSVSYAAMAGNNLAIKLPEVCPMAINGSSNLHSCFRGGHVFKWFELSVAQYICLFSRVITDCVTLHTQKKRINVYLYFPGIHYTPII